MRSAAAEPTGRRAVVSTSSLAITAKPDRTLSARSKRTGDAKLPANVWLWSPVARMSPLGGRGELVAASRSHRSLAPTWSRSRTARTHASRWPGPRTSRSAIATRTAPMQIYSPGRCRARGPGRRRRSRRGRRRRPLLDFDQMLTTHTRKGGRDVPTPWELPSRASWPP